MYIQRQKEIKIILIGLHILYLENIKLILKQAVHNLRNSLLTLKSLFRRFRYVLFESIHIFCIIYQT